MPGNFRFPQTTRSKPACEVANANLSILLHNHALPSTDAIFCAKDGIRSFAAANKHMKTKLIGSQLAACVVLTLTMGCRTELAATQTVQQAAGAASTQGLLDQARSLIADQRYKDAQTVLNQLASMNLSLDQHKLLTDLETQVQQRPEQEIKRAGARAAAVTCPSLRPASSLWPVICFGHELLANTGKQEPSVFNDEPQSQNQRFDSTDFREAIARLTRMHKTKKDRNRYA